MTTEPITIEFRYPWTMVPLESSGEWINVLQNALKPSDPLFGKDIFVSGRQEISQLFLVANDTDGNYAIVSVEADTSSRSYTCTTITLISSRVELENKLKQDHKEAVRSDGGCAALIHPT